MRTSIHTSEGALSLPESGEKAAAQMVETPQSTPGPVRKVTKIKEGITIEMKMEERVEEKPKPPVKRKGAPPKFLRGLEDMDIQEGALFKLAGKLLKSTFLLKRIHWRK